MECLGSGSARPHAGFHASHQGELDQVRARQHDFDLRGGSRQPAAGVIGEQEQKILRDEHGPDTSQAPPGSEALRIKPATPATSPSLRYLPLPSASGSVRIRGTTLQFRSCVHRSTDSHRSCTRNSPRFEVPFGEVTFSVEHTMIPSCSSSQPVFLDVIVFNEDSPGDP